PVEHRVSYKLVTLAHTIRTSGQPSYLRELLPDYEPARTLRSSSRHLLQETVTKTVLASRSFRHSAAAVWNSLPDSVRCCSNFDSFKHNLITHLSIYRLAYCPCLRIANSYIPYFL